MENRRQATKYELTGRESRLALLNAYVDIIVWVVVNRPTKIHVALHNIGSTAIEARIKQYEEQLAGKGFKFLKLSVEDLPVVWARFEVTSSESEKRVVESALRTMAHLFKVPAVSMSPDPFVNQMRIYHERQVRESGEEPWRMEGEAVLRSVFEQFSMPRDYALALLAKCHAKKGIHRTDDYWLRWELDSQVVASGIFSGRTAGASPSHQDRVTVRGTLDYGETEFRGDSAFRELYRTVELVPYDS